ncbi:MAG TPA: DUF4097 family beta strand repeat-containing protein [Chitinophagaceae bacterium]|nr:DUF4097 family beta strand repeat-containing protein [Chitinophagaceae bacterium]
MKIKNHLLALIVVMLGTTIASAQQEFKLPVQNSKDGKLTLIEFSGDLPIEGYSGNEIIITGEARKPDNSTRAKGLKPIYPGGEDNTGIALFMEKSGNQVSFRCLLPITHGQGNYKIKVPDNFKIEVDNECAKGRKVDVRNLKNEIEIKNCMGIDLRNVTGPMVLSTIAGDVNVVFTELNVDKPLSLASVSGDIDITLPAKVGVDVEMSTITGAIYSDFDFPAKEGEKNLKKVGGGGGVKSALNGGGVSIKITNVSGNIYLRKGK